MLPDYDDIRSLIDREPDWFDEGGVPRYAPFTPGMLGVYDEYALYVKIACQSCGKEFFIGHGWSSYDLVRQKVTAEEWPLEKQIEHGYHYGDPPRHGCVGDTMNCEDLELVEVWHKRGETEERDIGGKTTRVYTKLPEWERRHELEGPLHG